MTGDRDPLDVPLEDEELLDEVELTTTLIIAATQASGPLSRDEVDRLLRVAPTTGSTGQTGPHPLSARGRDTA
jgi:hypothetical protein